MSQVNTVDGSVSPAPILGNRPPVLAPARMGMFEEQLDLARLIAENSARAQARCAARDRDAKEEPQGSSAVSESSRAPELESSDTRPAEDGPAEREEAADTEDRATSDPAESEDGDRGPSGDGSPEKPEAANECDDKAAESPHVEAAEVEQSGDARDETAEARAPAQPTEDEAVRAVDAQAGDPTAKSEDGSERRGDSSGKEPAAAQGKTPQSAATTGETPADVANEGRNGRQQQPAEREVAARPDESSHAQASEAAEEEQVELKLGKPRNEGRRESNARVGQDGNQARVPRPASTPTETTAPSKGPAQPAATSQAPQAGPVAAAAGPPGGVSDNANQAKSGQPSTAVQEGAAPQSRGARPGPRQSAANGPADQQGGIDRVRFVQRVSRAFQSMRDGGGTVRLRLSPPELGSVRIELNVRQGVMTARMEVENAAARNAVLDSLPQLRERLAQQDIRVERFDIDLAGGSTEEGLPQRPGDDTPRQPRFASRARQAPARGTAREAPGTAEAPQRTGDASQLNVIV